MPEFATRVRAVTDHRAEAVATEAERAEIVVGPERASSAALRLLVRLPARSLLMGFTLTTRRIVKIDLIADPDTLVELPLD